MPVQGIRRPQLPAAPVRYSREEEQRFRGLLQTALLEIHGRFLNDETVVVETWDGGAITIDANATPDPVTTEHTLLTQSKSGVYLIDLTAAATPGVGQNTATINIQVDPDGASGYTTVTSYSWGLNSGTGPVTLPLTYTFTSQTLVAGGKVRIAGLGGGAGAWTLVLTPHRIRGQ